MDGVDGHADPREQGRRHDLDMLIQQHRAAVTAFGLLQKSAHQSPPKHHTIESILGLRRDGHVQDHGPQGGNESSGEYAAYFIIELTPKVS